MSAPFKMPDSNDIKSVARHFIFPTASLILVKGAEAALPEVAPQVVASIKDPTTQALVVVLFSGLARLIERWVRNTTKPTK